MHLLFVGCSWVAGDALAWDLLYPGETWRIGTSQYQQYCLDRRPYTLAHLTAGLVSATYTDLSRDGISNHSMALEAREFILKYPGDDLVVCVGWTDPARRRVWDHDRWIDLGLQYLDDPKLPRQWREYIRHSIVLRTDQDHLQDYLTACAILADLPVRLVQWRSVGTSFDPLGLPHVDAQGWISDPYGDSWHSRLTPSQRISPTNLHPNRLEVLAHADRIAARIPCI